MRTKWATSSVDRQQGRSRMTRHDRHRDKGQAFVELALVLPVFTLMLVGIVEVGRLEYASIEVNNAARAGVSYAAQTHTTAQDSTNIQLAATQDAPNLTKMTAVASYSCSCEGSTGTLPAPADCSTISLTSCASPSRIVEFVQVNTTATVPTLFHFPGIASTITLRGQAIMRVLQ
jgi:Flp pilus assembly protein TadG